MYFIEDEMKEHVIECFKTGFISHFEYPPPEPKGHVDNYDPLRTPKDRAVLTEAMKKQVILRKMIGGPG